MISRLNKEQIKNHIQRQFGLPEEQVEEMIPIFLATLAEHLKNLEQTVDGGNYLEIGAAAHTIKGALLNLGLSESAELALSIEQKGKSAESGADFRTILDALRSQLDDYLE